MSTQPQSFDSHRRWFPLYHYFVQPVLLANLVVQLWRLGADPSLATVWAAIVAAGLEGLALAARYMAIVNQRRIIRLEERLRLREILPEDLRGRVDELQLRHLVALRFASDAEVPDLTRRCLAGELDKADDVKREIREWRPDWLRV